MSVRPARVTVVRSGSCALRLESGPFEPQRTGFVEPGAGRALRRGRVRAAHRGAERGPDSARAFSAHSIIKATLDINATNPERRAAPRRARASYRRAGPCRASRGRARPGLRSPHARAARRSLCPYARQRPHPIKSARSARAQFRTRIIEGSASFSSDVILTRFLRGQQLLHPAFCLRPEHRTRPKAQGRTRVLAFSVRSVPVVPSLWPSLRPKKTRQTK